MIHGRIDRPESFAELIQHPAWKSVFLWLEIAFKELPPDGEYPIRDGVRAIVQTLKVGPRENEDFEAHQQEIDVHFCLSGSEIIEWMPLEALTAKTEYDSQKDYTFFEKPTTVVPPAIIMRRGDWVIFFPQDAHMPGVISFPHLTAVRKIVAKVNAQLVPSP